MEKNDMEYFRIEQERGISSYPQINSTLLPACDEPNKRVFSRSSSKQSRENYIVLPFIEMPKGSEFIFIISKELKKLFSAYQEGGQYLPFFTTDIEGKGLPYYVFYPLVLECLSDETEFNIDESVNKLVLSVEKIGNNKIFQVGGIKRRPYLIVDLEILELMLYNGEYPFVYTPVLLSTQKEV